MFPLLFLACRKDDDFKGEVTQESTLQVRELYSHEIRDIKELSSKLQQFNAPPRITYSEDRQEGNQPAPVKEYFKVDDSYGKEIVEGNYISYTFQMLPRKGKRNLSQLVNMVYAKNEFGDLVEKWVVVYYLTDDQVERLKNGQKMMDEIRYNYFPPDQERYYTSNSIGQPCDGVNCGPGYHKEKVGEGTSSATGWATDLCDCVSDVIHPVDNSLSDRYGGGGSGFGEGEIYGLPDLGPPTHPGSGVGEGPYNGPGGLPVSGGNTSGSSPGASSPGNQDEDNQDNGQTEEQNDCIKEGTCDATSRVFKIDPMSEYKEDCNTLHALSTSEVLNNQFERLENGLGKDHELGFFVETTADGIGSEQVHKATDYSDKHELGKNHVKMSNNPKVFIQAHTHYDGLMKMFSADDLFNFYKMTKRFNDLMNGDLAPDDLPDYISATSFLTVQGYTFALRMDDLEGFSDIEVNFDAKDKAKEINDKFRKAYNNTGVSPNRLANTFLGLAESLGIKISLFRSKNEDIGYDPNLDDDSQYSNWSRLTKGKTSVKAKPCNI